MALSERAEAGLKKSNFMLGYADAYLANRYEAKTNPQGIINLGMAESTLCEDIMAERLNQMDTTQVETWQQYYSNFQGAVSFRRVVADFLTKYFDSATRIDASDLMITAGVGAAMEHVAFACTDPGDCILIPTPVYAVILANINRRMNVKWFPIPLSSEPEKPGDQPFQISPKLLEDTYKKALAQGERVKAVLLVNPTNPTGTVFNRQSMDNILDFTRRHELHLIADEIFGLTIHGEDTKFPSILSFPEALDSERVHMLWGISKDLGLCGFRIGAICTRNKRMLKSLVEPAYLGSVSSLSQGVVARLLMDHEWLNTVYFPTNRSRLQKAHKFMKEELTKRGIIPHPAEATFFIWADFRKYASTAEEEKKLFDQLFKAGLYMVPGFALHAPEPGWIRITKTAKMAHVQLAFQRMDRVLGIKTAKL